ncbi:PREDICTED: Golgi membrane protein 1 isoform X1 [Poecilia mexicana]|uniref:Golgi membrane protein 1 n=1 Tax=Poecilia mexicana TaxID=48701 RepID=A0A3B3Y2N4_9TELE|nr:PREDICTED: Golgi membrane protein 1 isoform X1 [Poecilia mexicana]XP_014849763.1 PREDICTED: Golgi membrane protein 1 isoform X1 [Poecilia mexicana]
MGGLGNGRRGGRAPPLMVAALIACILVLGFNYWVSSSRNLELQTKLYELEGQVRRGAAERGVAEMKKNEFQDQIQKQVEEISHIESLRRKQLDTYSQEKAKLQQNISSSTKTIEELKGQLNQMNNDLGKLQKELQRCQANTSILGNKLTVDIAHCQSQVLSQKKLCDEKVAAVKLEVQKNVQKVVPPAGSPTQQKKAEAGEQKEEPIGKAAPTEAEAAAAAVSQKPNIPQGKGSKASELLINNINTDKEWSEQPLIDDLSKAESQSVPMVGSENRNKLQQKEGEGKTSEATTRKGLTNHLMDDKDIEVMDVHEEDARTEEADQGVQDILNGQEKPEETANGQRPEEPDEYDGDEQVVDGVDLEKEQRNKNTEEEMADYNGDDENEGEFEADKQAALAQN